MTQPDESYLSCSVIHNCVLAGSIIGFVVRTTSSHIVIPIGCGSIAMIFHISQHLVMCYLHKPTLPAFRNFQSFLSGLAQHTVSLRLATFWGSSIGLAQASLIIPFLVKAKVWIKQLLPFSSKQQIGIYIFT